jgi:hypothetical protein
MKGIWRLALLCGGCLAAANASAQAVTPANALQAGNYTIYSGDFNGDGRTDILAKAKPRIAMIALDDLSVPLAIFASPTFALLSSGSSFTLVNKPESNVVNSGVWQANTHTIAFGNFLGNGITSMMIRAQVPNGDSFTITTPAGVIQPTLLQRISSTDLGLDLGASGRSVEFSDANRDGRQDLVVRTSGRITDVFVADENGQFVRAPGNPGSIVAAWNGLRASLDASDPASALGFFSTESRNRYDAVFQRLGSQLPNLSPRWSGLEQIRVSSLEATYSIKQTFEGVTTDYLVQFVYQDGRWVLLEL